MNKTYKAVYYDSSGQFFNATIFLSSITLSIQYADENNVVKEVYWLAENITSLEEEALASILTYKNKNAQTERLVIRDVELLQAIKKHFSGRPFAGGWRYRMIGSTRNKIILFISISLALVMAVYFWFVPWLGERIARNISKEWEIGMGDRMYQSIIRQVKVDSAKTKLINSFYSELHYDIDYPVNITVVESKEINAFAIPGGHIVVYNSILAQMHAPEQLAALIAHEASHIALRHSLRNIFRSMARKVFLMLLVGNEAGLAGSLVDRADNLKGLEYSRSLETEADNYGIRLMSDNNIDATGMLHLMAILQGATKDKEPAAFLSTHPVFASRIENIKRQMPKKELTPNKHESLKSIYAELQQRHW